MLGMTYFGLLPALAGGVLGAGAAGSGRCRRARGSGRSSAC